MKRIITFSVLAILPILLVFLLSPLVAAQKSVTFKFCPDAYEKLNDTTIKSVHLAGTFNGWNPGPKVKKDEKTGEIYKALKMKKVGQCYKLTVKLDAGEYPYKFVINGTTWMADKGAEKFVEDGFGGENSVKVVK